MERASLEAGPGAAAHLLGRPPDDALLAQIAPLGFDALPGARDVELGGASYRPIVCDLGPESVAGWLSGLAARDLPVAGRRCSTSDARELVLDGRRVALTKLECDVLRYLREREGQPVAREALLRDVWGYEWTRRLQRRRGRRLRPAAQARRPRGRAGDRARRRLPPAARSDHTAGVGLL